MDVKLYQEESRNLCNEIFTNQYYTERFNGCLKKHNITVDSIDKQSKAKLNLFWNDFWFSLPDSPSIRTNTFFHLCDLCEDGDEEYDDSIAF